MRYRNKLTGYEFETDSLVSAPNYEKLGADPAPEVIKEPQEPAKPVTKKKPAKRGAKK